MPAAGQDDLTEGLPPISGPRIHTLILGSLPSRKSLELGEYYGHPRNAFWPIMGRLFDAGRELPYEERKTRLVAAGIGVWDVLQSSVRPGSLDASIDVDSATANDFETFFAAHESITRIAFNGRAAAKLFAAKVTRNDARIASGCEQLPLPSTSPASAAMRFEEKLARWSIVGERRHPAG